MKKQNIRIAYIINAFSWGGAEKLVFDLALHIKGLVESVSIIALYRNNNETETQMITELNCNGINTYIIGKPAGKGRVKCIKAISKYIKAQKANIIHAHCSVPMLFGKMSGALLGVPVVCTIHNTRGYSVVREVATKSMVTMYISICKAAEDYMVNTLRIPQRKIVRIYNAIDLNKFCAKDKISDFWEQYNGNINDINILNVARVNEQKNQLCLLRALKRLVDNGVKAHVYILGEYDISNSTYILLTEYIKKQDLDNRVTFLGMHTNVCDFLRNSDCFVMTSWFEGLSVAFLEAVICKVPIITTDMPFVEELMNIGKCATVISQDDDLALYKTLVNRDFFVPKQEVVDSFKAAFSIDAFCDRHLDLYGRFVN